MTLQRHLMMRLLIIGAFVFSGAVVYSFANWLIWNDPVYQRVFWSPFRPVALLAGMIEQIGLWCPLAAGLFLGVLVVVTNANRWLLLPAGLLILGLGIFILISFL